MSTSSHSIVRKFMGLFLGAPIIANLAKATPARPGQLPALAPHWPGQGQPHQHQPAPARQPPQRKRAARVRRRGKAS